MQSAEDVVARPALQAVIGARSPIRSYFALVKPRIIELLLITTVPSMILAARGWPSPYLTIATVIGGGLSAAGANALNCWVERDRDALMRRTRHRPLPAHEIPPAHALEFGLLLLSISAALLLVFTNLLATSFSLGAAAFYVLVYTMWLKPRTTSNIVIGGAAGAMPVFVGWAAVTNTVAWAPTLLALLIFLWTPPHFWALALKYTEDYRRANLPMLPVVRGVSVTTRAILRYSIFLTLASAAVPFVSTVGAIYIAFAVVSGVALVFSATSLHRSPNPARAIGFFRLSNVYLATLFIAIALDTLLA